MRVLIIIFVIAALYSCTEEFELKTNESIGRIVITGTITNETGPYFFKISKSDLYTGTPARNEGINNALVIISDDTGVNDTLKALNKVSFHPIAYYYYIVIKKYDGEFDTIHLLGRDTSVIKGVYYTNQIKGIPGNRYSLTVVYNGKVYKASEQMPKVVPLDSMQLRVHYLESDGSEVYVPYVYFKEPKNEANYYMFNFGYDKLFNILYGTSLIWNYSVLDDRFLPEYVNGFNIDDGASPNGMEEGTGYFTPGNTAIVRMHSITQSSYNYHKSLLKQFENDGGAYTPTPTTPPSNLSNGALGFFMVSSVSEAKKYVNY